jgi:hypothetical protein
MPLGPTSIVFSFLISHRAKKKFGASCSPGAFCFLADFFWPKSQLLTPEMDSRAKTKCKTIKRYFFFSMKIKSFVPKILTTLFISLKVAHSAQEAPKKISARWLIKKLKTIEVGPNGIGCAAALYGVQVKLRYDFLPASTRSVPPGLHFALLLLLLLLLLFFLGSL